MGRLLRVGRGRYACPHLDEQRLAAARTCGQIDCVAALARHEVWSGIDSPNLHLRVTAGRHHPPAPDATLHWAALVAPPHNGEVSPLDALLQAIRCLAPYDWLASVESALHLGYLDNAGLGSLGQLAPRWIQPTLARLNRGAQSGLETHPRLMLEDAGHEIVTQVRMPGAGILDILIDDCVGLETDGAKWHAETFMADRTKDIAVEWWGIRVLRVGAPHIFETWPQTLATLERMIADSPRRRA